MMYAQQLDKSVDLSLEEKHFLNRLHRPVDTIDEDEAKEPMHSLQLTENLYCKILWKPLSEP